MPFADELACWVRASSGGVRAYRSCARPDGKLFASSRRSGSSGSPLANSGRPASSTSGTTLMVSSSTRVALQVAQQRGERLLHARREEHPPRLLGLGVLGAELDDALLKRVGPDCPSNMQRQTLADAMAKESEPSANGDRGESSGEWLAQHSLRSVFGALPAVPEMTSALVAHHEAAPRQAACPACRRSRSRRSLTIHHQSSIYLRLYYEST